MSLRLKIDERARMLSIAPKRSLGQNFLVSDIIVDRIVDTARELIDDQSISDVVEVGPGLGSLTDQLQGLPCSLTVVELDRNFAEFWRQQGIKVIEADALQWNWSELEQRTLLVSNLPYQISSSLVIERSLGPDAVRGMVLMFQKEVAQRLRAKARSPDYGLLSVLGQVFWRIETVVDAGPREFWPSPRVASRVLRFVRREVSPSLNRVSFLTFVKQAFGQRRKLVAKNLSSWPRAQSALVDLGYDPLRARAEEITPERYVELFGRISAQN